MHLVRGYLVVQEVHHLQAFQALLEDLVVQEVHHLQAFQALLEDLVEQEVHLILEDLEVQEERP